MKAVKLNPQQQFFLRMNKLAKPYFDAQKNGHYGNGTLYLKAVILFATLGTTWWAMYIFVPSIYTDVGVFASFVIGIMLAIILGLTKAGLGFNVMHDALHNSFSKDKKLNRVLGNVLNLLGGEVLVWLWQHNENHHNETNIAGHDNDFDLGGLGRLSPEHPYKPVYKYQHIYLWFAYCLSYSGWKYYFDYPKARKMGWSKGRVFMLFVKKLFINHLVFLIVPFIICPFWYALTVYLVADLVCGLTTAWVFQLAHVVEETEMFPDTNEKIIFDPFHQIKTTASFGVNQKFLTWFTGGLNFQGVHHLYPWVSHVHYPALHKIMCQVCYDFGLTPIVFKNFWQATLSHQRQLKKLGQPPTVLAKPATT